jgi:hypothetical protein
MSKIEAETELKGGKVNYYLVRVEHPQREEQPPYTAECEDIGEALELTPNEMNVFKEIWRSANARKGNGKPGHAAIYGAEKIVHYAGRILRRAKIDAEPKPKMVNGWVANTGEQPVNNNIDVEIEAANGNRAIAKAGALSWVKRNGPGDIIKWRRVP